MQQRDTDSAAEEKVRAAVPGFEKRPRGEIYTRIKIVEIISRLAKQLDRTERDGADHRWGKAGHRDVINAVRAEGAKRIIGMSEVDISGFHADERVESKSHERLPCIVAGMGDIGDRRADIIEVV